MKVVNKIMIGIAVLCLLLCGGILVFALNPDMTSSLRRNCMAIQWICPLGPKRPGKDRLPGMEISVDAS